jgi:DNA-binding MarR family transcriptional regulator
MPDDLGLADALTQLTFLVQGTLARHAAEHDLSMAQSRLLGILRDRRPTMNELARMLELDKSSVTGLVDRAERRGLLQRTPSPDDRRSMHVSLTPAGRRLVRDVVADFDAEIAEVTECLSPTQRQQLSVLATKVVLHYQANI